MASETAAAPESGKHDPAEWRVHTTIAKFDGDFTAEQIDAGEAPDPFEVIEDEGNLLLIGGVSRSGRSLIGNGTATAAQALTYFNNGNARHRRRHVEHGGGGHADAHGRRVRRRWTRPTRRTRTRRARPARRRSRSGRRSARAADANQAWNEWGMDNGTRLLNRKVAANGTKASGQTWQFTVTIALA
jgi:hypothetical protein